MYFFRGNFCTSDKIFANGYNGVTKFCYTYRIGLFTPAPKDPTSDCENLDFCPQTLKIGKDGYRLLKTNYLTLFYREDFQTTSYTRLTFLSNFTRDFSGTFRTFFPSEATKTSISD